MPIDLCDHAAFAVPRSGLIAEAGAGPADMIERATDGPRERVCDACLQGPVSLETGGAGVAIGFRDLLDVRQGAGGHTSNVTSEFAVPITAVTRAPHSTPVP